MGPKGDIILEERLRRKYGGLKWVDDKDYHRYTARSDAMFSSKKRADNQYLVLGVRDGYDTSLEANRQEELYEPWQRTEDFYEMVTMHNKEDPLIKFYQKDEDCESEEE